MANRGVTNIVPANNVLLLQDCLTENWTLIQMIGDVLNWLAKRRLLKNCMCGTSEYLFETYLVEYMWRTRIHYSPFSSILVPSAQTKTDTKTVIFISTNLIKLYLVAFKHRLKKASIVDAMDAQVVQNIVPSSNRPTSMFHEFPFISHCNK